MSILDAHVRRASARSARNVAGAAAFALPAIALAACTDEPVRVTAPDAPAQHPAAATARRAGPPDPVASVVFCDVARRLASGQYRTRVVSISVPREIFGNDGRTVTLGSRGWTGAESAPPARLAACEIPDTRAAVEWFERYFAARSPRAGVQTDRVVAAAVAATSARVTEPGVLVMDMLEPCDPYAIDTSNCECTSVDCPDESPPQEPDEGPAPTDPDSPNFSVAPDYYSVPIVCEGRTDRPHLSTTPGFFLRASVHSQTSCPVPLPISVRVNLQKQSCFWFICWYSTEGSGSYANTATLARTHANAFCKRGWWRGVGYHTVQFPSGFVGTAVTRHSAYILC